MIKNVLYMSKGISCRTCSRRNVK